jgi:hypothetical protein
LGQHTTTSERIDERVNPARPLQAVAAAQPGLAEAALRQLHEIAIPDEFRAEFLRDAEHFD